ncbi:hypothetical protein GJ496_010957 [Pomphorhynchus laevis]|nr:hypothetical protein GJ496_010957 [Pomphorhynchus laevis]
MSLRRIQSLYDIVASALSWQDNLLTDDVIKILSPQTVQRLSSFLSSYHLSKIGRLRPMINLNMYWILHRSFLWQLDACLNVRHAHLQLNPMDEYYLSNFIYAGYKDIIINFEDTWENVVYTLALDLIPLHVICTNIPKVCLNEAKLSFKFVVSSTSVNRFNLLASYTVKPSNPYFYFNSTKLAAKVKRLKMARLFECRYYFSVETCTQQKLKSLRISSYDPDYRLQQVGLPRKFLNLFRYLKKASKIHMFSPKVMITFNEHLFNIDVVSSKPYSLINETAKRKSTIRFQPAGKYVKSFHVLSSSKIAKQLNIHDSLAIGVITPLPDILQNSWTCNALSAALDLFLLNSTGRSLLPRSITNPEQWRFKEDVHQLSNKIFDFFPNKTQSESKLLHFIIPELRHGPDISLSFNEIIHQIWNSLTYNKIKKCHDAYNSLIQLPVRNFFGLNKLILSGFNENMCLNLAHQYSTIEFTQFASVNLEFIYDANIKTICRIPCLRAVNDLCLRKSTNQNTEWSPVLKKTYPWQNIAHQHVLVTVSNFGKELELENFELSIEDLKTLIIWLRKAVHIRRLTLSNINLTSRAKRHVSSSILVSLVSEIGIRPNIESLHMNKLGYIGFGNGERMHFYRKQHGQTRIPRYIDLVLTHYQEYRHYEYINYIIIFHVKT